MDERVSIIIPTFNRSHWLEKSLKFLSGSCEGFRIHVIDGGSDESKLENQKIIEELGNSAIHYSQYQTSLHLGLRIFDAIKKVRTPYVLIWPDDDFLVARNLNEIVDFLDQNLDYSAALGKVLCLTRWDKIKAVFPRTSFYLLNHLRYSPSVVDDSPLRRIITYFLLTRLGGMPLFYSVRRTDQLLAGFKEINGDTKYSVMELVLNSLCLIDGKVKCFDFLFGFRNYASKPTDCVLREDQESYFPADQLAYAKEVVAKRFEKSGLTTQEASFAFDQVMKAPYNPSNYTLSHGTSVEASYKFYRLYRNVQMAFDFLGLDWMRLVYGVSSADYRELKKILVM